MGGGGSMVWLKMYRECNPCRPDQGHIHILTYVEYLYISVNLTVF